MPTVLMTGGHSGLGFVGAQTLAKRYGCDLILAGRNRERVEKSAQLLRAETGRRVVVLDLDLNSLASVRDAMAECKILLKSGVAEDQKLQGIICNAGVQYKEEVKYSADGFEETFASNCLGHFLLVNLLLDSIATGGRVVWTTSGTHDPALLDGKTVGLAIEPDADALAYQGRNNPAISGGRRYATSKLCVVMYAYELHRRLRKAEKQIASIAYDPGFVPEIGMGLGAPPLFRKSIIKFVLRNLGMTMGQMPLSGEALAMIAEDAAYASSSGKYFHPKNGAIKETRSSAASYDEKLATKLWLDSERLVQLDDASRPVFLK